MYTDEDEIKALRAKVQQQERVIQELTNDLSRVLLKFRESSDSATQAFVEEMDTKLRPYQPPPDQL